LPLSEPPFVTVFGHEGATRDAPRLTWVEEESERVASAYGRNGRTQTFVGSEATAARFREWSAKTEILHVAAHAFGDELAASRARLELAPGTEASGRVEIAEILRLRPARTRVVMLSACSTADPAAAARGGASTLSLAFLAAGVPSVIGSLWTVDDSEWTAGLAGEFHARLAEGLRVSESLARAQRRLITAGAPPRVWAVFQVYGAGGVD
jgi:CHAT domain-containing protein